MTDLFGVPLNVGDRVAYTTGAQSNMTLELGSILEIDADYWSTSRASGPAAALIKTASGRKASNWRSAKSLIAVAPIASQHPELFI